MLRKIKDTGLTQRKINPEKVAKAIGAEKVKVKIDTRQGPISLFTLRQFLITQLRSSGGRPSVVIKGRRNKIPFYNEDWNALKTMAKLYREKEGIKVTPGQIAAALIHKEISKIKI